VKPQSSVILVSACPASGRMAAPGSPTGAVTTIEPDC
jgi:hypothetical protein